MLLEKKLHVILYGKNNIGNIMKLLTFAFNEDTYNTEIKVLDETLDLKNASLKILYLKSFDDEDYYGFDIEENECEIKNLQFNNTGDNCYEICFDAIIKIDNVKWSNADKNFKDNAENSLIEVVFDLECGDRVFEEGDHFEKQYDGQTELYID